MADNTFWESFGDSSMYQEVEDGFTGSLASDVVESYGLECSTPSIGGSLSSLDIKHMDALQLIKISLLQDSLRNSSGPYEAYVNYADGKVEFREVGNYAAEVSDIYFEVQTSKYTERCSGVMITGKKPLVERLPKEWVSVFTEGRKVYDFTDMLSNCHKKGFSSVATVVYRDPNLNTAYNDGIDNLYNVTDPFESVIGYARMITAPDIKNNTNITHSRQSTIPVKVPDAIDKLIRRPQIDAGQEELGSECWNVLSAEAEGGVEIPIKDLNFRYETNYGTTQDNFIGIAKVYVVGTQLTFCGSKPSSVAALNNALTGADIAADHEIWVSIDETKRQTIRLEEDEDYVINYVDGENPKIQFANNSRTYDKGVYGKDTKYHVNPLCKYAVGKKLGEQTGTILPKGDSGILVDEVWVVVNLDTPSINVHDPNGKAYDIAMGLEYDLMPIVIYEEPQPVGFNGTLINQRDGIADKDPTTRQASFNNTQMEQAMNQLDGGGGFSLSLSFLDANEVADLSGMLYRYMNNGTGIETVYTCGPDCNPKVGGYHSSGGIINRVVHSYTDSGSYTVSVSESNRLIEDTDLVGISGGPYFKRAESPSVKGTVIDDLGNHIHFKVRIDGFGEQIAINCQPEVLRVGDKITCTVHNNPVEQ